MSQPNASKSPKKVMTLANKITVARIITIPILVIAMLEQKSILVYSLLGFSMATDLLDGLAARMRGERTKLGAFLDPMADKLLLTSLYMTLTYQGVIHVWIFIVIFSRDLLIVLGWAIIFILTGSSIIQPRLLGKITTAVQMTVALILMTGIANEWERFFIWPMIAFTIASAVDYMIIGERRLGEWS